MNKKSTFLSFLLNSLGVFEFVKSDNIATVYHTLKHDQYFRAGCHMSF